MLRRVLDDQQRQARFITFDRDAAGAGEGHEVAMSLKHVGVARQRPEVQSFIVKDRRLVPKLPVDRIGVDRKTSVVGLKSII
jgi:hypothetical protein